MKLDANQFTSYISWLCWQDSEAGLPHGHETRAEKPIKERLAQDKFGTQFLLAQLYFNSRNNPRVRDVLLRTIGYIDDADIQPIGYYLATNAILTGDTELQEYGVRCLERWGTKECLNVLKIAKVSEPWLQDYINAVIRDIEKGLKNNGA